MLITAISTCVWQESQRKSCKKFLKGYQKVNKFCALSFCEINIKIINFKPAIYKKNIPKKICSSFLIVLLIRVLLKPRFLKQHKTELEQYSLLPTSTATSCTCQPLNSMIISKVKYLLNLVPCQDSIFS